MTSDLQTRYNKNMEKSIKFTFRIAPKQIETLKMLADREGRSMASMLRRLVEKEDKDQICTTFNKNGDVASVDVSKQPRP